MRQLEKQIQESNYQKLELENISKNNLLKIAKYKNNLELIQEEIKILDLEIIDYTNKINQLSINFKPNIFQIFIKILSFGIKNYEKEYLINIETLSEEIQNIKNILLLKKENILKVKNNLSNKEIEENQNSQKIKQIKYNILEFENKFDNKLELFKNILEAFQNKLIQISKYMYINDYNRKKFKNKLDSVLENKEEFINHQKIKNFIQEIILFYNNDKLWVKNRNIEFLKNEMITEKSFFDTIESKPLTKK